MELLLVDNYDSFTYNIVHIFNGLPDVKVSIISADRVKCDQLDHFDALIFSPGPDIPRKGDTMDRILGSYGHKLPLLGICLGLQAIVMFFGGSIYRLKEVVHGRTKKVRVVSENSSLFTGLNHEFDAGLYHSWVAAKDSLPGCLEITALSEENRIMALRHRQYNIEAVQFHPESIMTPDGSYMMHNWLNALKK